MKYNMGLKIHFYIHIWIFSGITKDLVEISWTGKYATLDKGQHQMFFSKKEAIFTKRFSYFSNGNKNGVAPILQGRQFNFSGEFWFALITNINNNNIIKISSL